MTSASTIADMRHQVVNELVLQYIPPNAYAEQWNTAELKSEVQRIFDLDLPVDAWAAEEGIADQEIIERLQREVDEKAAAKQAQFGPDAMLQIEKMVLLQNIDHLWREHLITLEHLRQVIGFRSYGQRDPLNEYKSEGFVLFEALLTNLREAVTGTLMHIQSVPAEEDEDARGGAAADAGPPRGPVHGRGRARHGGCRARRRGPPRRDAGRAARARADAQERLGGQSQGPRHLGQGGPQRRPARAAPARSTNTATASTTDGVSICGRKTGLGLTI